MTIQDCCYDIEGALVAFLGDTPAVNMAGGFKEGVGQAMRKCRHCLATHSQIQTKVYIIIVHAEYISPNCCAFHNTVCRRRVSGQKYSSTHSTLCLY